MKKTFMTNNDLSCGMILTTKNDSKYVVVADDNGHHDVIRLNGDKAGNSNGIEVGRGKFAICGGKADDNGRTIVKVEEFSGQPTRNRLSEGLKYLTGRKFTEKLTTIWEAEDPAVALAKAKYEAAIKAAEDAKKAYLNLL